MMKTIRNSVKVVTLFIAVSLLFSLSVMPSRAVETTTWDKKTTTDRMKTWTISFNEPVRTKSVDGKSIYVVTAANQLVKTSWEVSDDGYQVKVSPEQTYDVGVKYWLFIDDSVRSDDWDELEASITMPFEIIGDEVNGGTDQNESNNGSNSDQEEDGQAGNEGEQAANSEENSELDIAVEVSDYVANVTVRTDATIGKVMIDQYNMHYVGNDTFNLGLAGVQKGDSLYFKAYNGEGKLVVRKRYEVE